MSPDLTWIITIKAPAKPLQTRLPALSLFLVINPPYCQNGPRSSCLGCPRHWRWTCRPECQSHACPRHALDCRLRLWSISQQIGHPHARTSDLGPPQPAGLPRRRRTETLTRYDTIRFHDQAVEQLVKLDKSGLFKPVSDDGKHWLGRKVVLATGVRDVLPDLDGYESAWVKGM